MTAGARAGIITDTGFIGGDCCWEEKQSQTEALQPGCGEFSGVDVSTRVFPSNEAVQYSDECCCCFTVFEHITNIRAGSTGSFLSPAMANNTNNGHLS